MKDPQWLYRAAFAGMVFGLFHLPGSTGRPAGGPGAATPGGAAWPPAEAVRIVSADELISRMPRSDDYSETRRNLKWIELGRQKWLNYSFFRKDRAALKPDWPISLIFYGNATVEKVKAIYGKYRLSTRKHILYEAGAGPVWDSDSGVKSDVWFKGPDGLDKDAFHLRIFAPPAGFFEGEGSWGHYVIATAHFDFNPPLDSVCGYSEDAEYLAVRIAERKGYEAAYRYVNLFNGETFRVKKHHYRQSDGYASLVYIP